MENRKVGKSKILKIGNSEIRKIGKSEIRKILNLFTLLFLYFCDRTFGMSEVQKIEKWENWRFGSPKIWKFRNLVNRKFGNSQNRRFGKTEIRQIAKSERKGILKNKRITAMSLSCLFICRLRVPRRSAPFYIIISKNAALRKIEFLCWDSGRNSHFLILEKCFGVFRYRRQDFIVLKRPALGCTINSEGW